MLLLTALLMAAAQPLLAPAPSTTAGTPSEPTAAPAAVPVDNTPEAFIMPPKGAVGSVASPDDISADSARDLKDNRYYNKPHGTRAEYDKDWQECRLIARGSINPTGAPTVIVYNPAVISPAAAGAGGLIGGLIAAAIQEGEQRRANRRNCLLIKGWRLVEVEPEQVTKFAALPDAERQAMFNRAIGDPDPKGRRIVRWSNQFAAPILAERP